jgi:hypothetical protein
MGVVNFTLGGSKGYVSLQATGQSVRALSQTRCVSAEHACKCVLPTCDHMHVHVLQHLGSGHACELDVSTLNIAS